MRAEFFKDISKEDVAEFIKKASEQTEQYNEIEGRMPEMTANDFYCFCAMGYAANNYEGCDMTPKGREKPGMKLHYVLQLWEPAAPSFCSFSKIYVGTKPELLKVAERLEQEQNMPETSVAIRAYFAGNHKATHNIAYHDITVLTPVRVLAESKLELKEREWEHLNAWEWPYKLRFACAEVSQIVVRYGGNYHRCMKATITDLCYEGIMGEWKSVGSMIFGNACVLHSAELPNEHHEFGNDLYVQEETSRTKEPLIQKLTDPEKVVFDRLCDEIFGDG